RRAQDFMNNRRHFGWLTRRGEALYGTLGLFTTALALAGRTCCATAGAFPLQSAATHRQEQRSRHARGGLQWQRSGHTLFVITLSFVPRDFGGIRAGSPFGVTGLPVFAARPIRPPACTLW